MLVKRCGACYRAIYLFGIRHEPLSRDALQLYMYSTAVLYVSTTKQLEELTRRMHAHQCHKMYQPLMHTQLWK